MKGGKKSYGMSEEAKATAERKLFELKEYIRDEGGDPKSFLAEAMGGAAPEESAEEESAESPSFEAKEDPGQMDDGKADKMSMAVALLKRKMK